MEIWKDIRGYEGLYAITSCARVWSYRKNIFLTPDQKPVGYFYVNLRNDGKYERFYIHRLVADAFIPNPENKPMINHINGIKTDNRIENLEWCTRSENAYHAHRTKLINTAREVLCIELNRTFPSVASAAKELNLQPARIVDCCKGRRAKTGGYHWQYSKKEAN